MKKFWELFEQSVITQALVTLCLIITTCVMFIKGLPIPPELSLLTTTVLGFWFGSKVGFKQGEQKAFARFTGVSHDRRND